MIIEVCEARTLRLLVESTVAVSLCCCDTIFVAALERCGIVRRLLKEECNVVWYNCHFDIGLYGRLSVQK